jgi:hypothetical protein
MVFLPSFVVGKKSRQPVTVFALICLFSKVKQKAATPCRLGELDESASLKMQKAPISLYFFYYICNPGKSI